MGIIMLSNKVRVDELNLAFSWVTDFIISNGLTRIPVLWSYPIEAFGVISWFVLFFIFVSIFAGYSKQLSAFYFLYEHMLGEKLSNPYKWAIIYSFVWLALHALSFWVSLIGVFFYKYGMINALIVTFLGLVVIMSSAFISYKVTRKKPKRRLYRPAYSPSHQIAHAPSPILLSHHGAQEQQVPVGAPQAYAVDLEQEKNEYYNALNLMGLEEGYSSSELKSRYKKLLKRVHSDKGGSDGLHFVVQQSYKILRGRCIG